VVNAYLVDELKKNKLWDHEMLGKIKYNDGSIANIKEIPEHIRAKYKEVFEIDPVWIVKAAAYRGKWIDQSQSLNIFFKGTSGKDISNIYLYAWAMGLKTTYYLRTLAISQVEKSTVNTAEYGTTHQRSFVTQQPFIAATVPAEPALASQKSTENSVTQEVVNHQNKQNTKETSPKLCAVIDPTCEACQ